MTKVFGNEYRKTLVCVDSYQNGVLKGRFYNPSQDGESFESLSQFLIKMENLLDHMNLPQSYTAARTFCAVEHPNSIARPAPYDQRGALATFEVRVIFRQHTSWQGVILWLDQHREQSFRSVLELILLMDSALQEAEDSGAA